MTKTLKFLPWTWQVSGGKVEDFLFTFVYYFDFYTHPKGEELLLKPELTLTLHWKQVATCQVP